MTPILRLSVIHSIALLIPICSLSQPGDSLNVDEIIRQATQANDTISERHSKIRKGMAAHLSNDRYDKALTLLNYLLEEQANSNDEVISYQDEFLVKLVAGDYRGALELSIRDGMDRFCNANFDKGFYHPPGWYGYRPAPIDDYSDSPHLQIINAAQKKRVRVFDKLDSSALSQDEIAFLKLAYNNEISGYNRYRQLHIAELHSEFPNSELFHKLDSTCSSRIAEASKAWISLDLAGFGGVFRDELSDAFTNPGGFKGSVAVGYKWFFAGFDIETGGSHPRDTIDTEFGDWYGGFDGNYTRTSVMAGVRIPFTSKVMASLYGGFSGARLKPRVNDDDDNNNRGNIELESVKVRSPENWFYGVDLSVGIDFRKSDQKFRNTNSGAAYSYFFARFEVIESDFSNPLIGEQRYFSASGGFRFVFRWKKDQTFMID